MDEKSRAETWWEVPDAALQELINKDAPRLLCAITGGDAAAAMVIASSMGSCGLELQDRAEELAYYYDEARMKIQKIIDDLESLLFAAQDSLAAIDARKSSWEIDEVTDLLDDYTEGHRGKISVGEGMAEVHQLVEYLNNIEQRDRKAARREEEAAVLRKPQPPSNGRLEGFEI